MADQMSTALIGHYPTDPTGALSDVMKFFQNGDQKFLFHGLYNLAGYALGLYFGEPAEHVDPAIVADAVHQVKTAMDSPGAQFKLPDWAKPILNLAMQALLMWLQGHSVMAFMAQNNGKMSNFMQPQPAAQSQPQPAAQSQPQPTP